LEGNFIVFNYFFLIRNRFECLVNVLWESQLLVRKLVGNSGATLNLVLRGVIGKLLVAPPAVLKVGHVVSVYVLTVTLGGSLSRRQKCGRCTVFAFALGGESGVVKKATGGTLPDPVPEGLPNFKLTLHE